jgi:hypothetical protein
LVEKAITGNVPAYRATSEQDGYAVARGLRTHGLLCVEQNDAANYMAMATHGRDPISVWVVFP